MTPAINAAFASRSLMAGLLALSSSMALAERAAPARMIKCEGPFGRNASHAGLVKAFGNNNVAYQEIGDAQDKRIKASVLYPNDPKARLEFVWGDEKARRRPRQIRAKDQSAWASANGIRIGTALADVDKDECQAIQAVGLRLGLRRPGHGLARRRAGQAPARRLQSRHRIRASGGRRRGEFDQGERRPRVPLRQCRYARGRALRRGGDLVLSEALITHAGIPRTCGARCAWRGVADAQKEWSPRRHRLLAAIVVEAALSLATEP